MRRMRMNRSCLRPPLRRRILALYQRQMGEPSRRTLAGLGSRATWLPRCRSGPKRRVVAKCHENMGEFLAMDIRVEPRPGPIHAVKQRAAWVGTSSRSDGQAKSTGHTGRDPGRAYWFVARPADPEDRQCRLVRVEPQRLAQLAGGRRAVKQLAQRMYEEVELGQREPHPQQRPPVLEQILRRVDAPDEHGDAAVVP